MMDLLTIITLSSFRGHTIETWEFTENLFDLFGVSEELVHLLLEDNNITFAGLLAVKRLFSFIYIFMYFHMYTNKLF
jgi:hypothetical protein